MRVEVFAWLILEAQEEESEPLQYITVSGNHLILEELELGANSL